MPKTTLSEKEPKEESVNTTERPKLHDKPLEWHPVFTQCTKNEIPTNPFFRLDGQYPTAEDVKAAGDINISPALFEP